MENLDRLCAEYGFNFAEEIRKAFNNDAKKAESLITKALGVLQEQGFYAFRLFCKSQGVEEILELFKNSNLSLINSLFKRILEDNGKENGKVNSEENGRENDKKNGKEDPASSLDDLMLAIEVLEKSLIYARYHAKAFSNSAEQTQSNEGAEK